ncbi:MAG TPA: hypothetical protein VK207_02985 [Bacteroidales bacterium]|nr:hypothetical protein [Bacteroidales bacterium]
MKFSHLFLVIVALFVAACGNKTGSTGESLSQPDTISVPDTGFTGIKQFTSGQYVVSQVTFKNSIREGLTKTFYPSGRLQRTFWYENGLRQDSSCWYYEEGQLFRTTPFINDTIDGVQKQYYRTGQLKAKMGYKKGFRTDFFQEFTREGQLVRDYPELIVKTQDNYAKNGSYRITLELSDKKTHVTFRKGEFINGAYDTTMMKKINTVQNTGYLDLKKTGKQKQQYVGVVAEILTNFGNRLLVYRKIDLPYSDLE